VSDKVIFDHVIRAMFKANLEKLSPAGLAKVTAQGIDPTQRLLPAYPAETWARCAKTLAEDLFPGQDTVEATRRVARNTVDAFAHELIGKAMFALCRLIGAERTARRMTQNFRSGSNFVDTKLTRVRDVPITNELWINDVSGLPGFYLGLLEGGIAHTAGETYVVTLTRLDGEGAVYQLKQILPEAVAAKA
jgi:uncharacterized protein (TIGR02265 family)